MPLIGLVLSCWILCTCISQAEDSCGIDCSMDKEDENSVILQARQDVFERVAAGVSDVIGTPAATSRSNASEDRIRAKETSSLHPHQYPTGYSSTVYLRDVVPDDPLAAGALEALFEEEQTALRSLFGLDRHKTLVCLFVLSVLLLLAGLCWCRLGGAVTQVGTKEVLTAGKYNIIQEGTRVDSTVDEQDGNEEVACLAQGTVVDVLEVVPCEDLRRVRGKIQSPAGWISLLDLDSGKQWAVQAEHDEPYQDELSNTQQSICSLLGPETVDQKVDAQ